MTTLFVGVPNRAVKSSREARLTKAIASAWARVSRKPPGATPVVRP